MNDSGWHSAVRERRADLVKSLAVRSGSCEEVNKRDMLGDCPIHIAAAGGMIEILGLLVEAGAIVNKKDSSGFTGLHKASEAGHSPCVTLLIQRFISYSSIFLSSFQFVFIAKVC